MKNLNEERFKIAVLAHEERRLFDYYQLLSNYAKPTDTEENQQYISRIIFSDYNYEKLDLKGCLDSFSYFQDNINYNLVYNIIKTSEELKTSNLAEFNEKIIILFSYWNELHNLNLKYYIENLQNSYNKKTVLPLFQSRNWHQSNCVFHATKMEHISNTLSEGKIYGYTTQRYWKDGRRRVETEPDYQDYLIMKGISTTRSLDFARNWGGFILVLDLEKIKYNTPVIPYAWNYHIKPSQYPQFRSNPKKETEEFVILSKTNRKFILSENEDFKKEYEAALKDQDIESIKYYEEKMNNLDLGEIKKPEGFLDISKCLKGIFIMSYMLDIYGIDHPSIQEVINHPLFLGILEK